MELTLKEKAKLFWERNKAMILGLVAMAGGATVIGAIGVHYTKKAEKEHQEELEAQRAKWEEERKAAEKKEEEAAIAAEDRIANNPDYQLTEGGYVAPDRNNLYEADCPNILANCVPLTSMGQFGQDIIDRYNKEWPNWEEVGMFNPETAVSDVYLDFGHEKWLEYQKGLEAESQEKQSA